MAPVWHRIALFCFFIAGAAGKRNPDLCDIVRENNGLIPPTIPKNFEMKFERLDNEKQQLSYREMYFDADGLRGKYLEILNGIERHYIVNYKVEQVLKYYDLHPGVPVGEDIMSEVCIADPIEMTDMKKIFGYRKSNKDMSRSRMFDSNEALQFGGPHPYAFNGTTKLDERGLNTNAFRGCIYDQDDDLTAATYYYFSDENTLPAGGTPEAVVDGLENTGFLSVPMARYSVVSENEIINSSLTLLTMSSYFDSIPWFKGDPVFATTTFQVPERLYCKNFRGEKTIPKLPPGFSVRYEMATYTQDMSGKLSGTVLLFYQMFYDYEKKLGRLDFTPLKEKDTEVINIFQSDEPIKSVYDYNSGVKYFVHKSTGKCVATSIGLGDMFDVSKGDLFAEMGSPEEALLMQADEMEYKGKAVVRDITTDVWTGKYLDKAFNLTVFKEIYLSTDGWYEESDDDLEFSAPVRLSISLNRLEDGVAQQVVTEKNFFKFKGKTPNLMMFDVSGCMQDVEHRFFGLMLSVGLQYQDTLFRYRWDFQQVMQHYISQASKIGTPLRVQRVLLRRSGTALVVTFALTAKMKLRQLRQDLSLGSQTGLSLDDALDNLRQYIESRKFELSFTPPPVNMFEEPEAIKVLVVPGNLYIYDPTKSLLGQQFFRPTSTIEPVAWDDKKPQENKPKPKKGMPPGGLAALAITMLIVGVGLGIAMMYAYLKKYGHVEGPGQFQMRPR